MDKPLSTAMRTVLGRLDTVEWRSASDADAPMRTLDAVQRRGLARVRHLLGRTFSRRGNIVFLLTAAGAAARDAERRP